MNTISYVGIVHILLKNGVPDHEAKGMERSLENIGFTGTRVTIGQCHRVKFSAPENEVNKILEEMCRKLLQNETLHRAEVRSLKVFPPEKSKTETETFDGDGRYLGVVHTFNRAAVLNPEEKTVRDALNNTLGFSVSEINLGKCYLVEFFSSGSAKETLKNMASKAFINPIMHEFSIEEIRPLGI